MKYQPEGSFKQGQLGWDFDITHSHAQALTHGPCLVIHQLGLMSSPASYYGTCLAMLGVAQNLKFSTYAHQDHINPG